MQGLKVLNEITLEEFGHFLFIENDLIVNLEGLQLIDLIEQEIAKGCNLILSQV